MFRSFPPNTMTDGKYQHVISDLVRLEDRIDDIEDTLADVTDRLAEVEQVVSPDPTSKDYDALSREEKVFRLRTAICRRAMEHGGTAAMKYGEVQATFGNRPSAGHAYDLMEHAAEADGFGYDTKTGDNRLTVKIQAVNDETVIHAANKTTDGVTA